MEKRFEFRKILKCHNQALSEIIRKNLEAHHLDIPGTAYFDKSLDSMSTYYSGASENTRQYYVLLDNGKVAGGIGFERFAPVSGCAELQKLYLDDSCKGNGLGYEMIAFIEDKMRKAGYDKSYLETHSSLKAAIREYEKSGYVLIERPEQAVHSTMDRFYMKNL